MGELPEYVDSLPNLCGSEQLVEAAIRAGRGQPVFGGPTPVGIAGIDSGFAVALHMHQPLIPAGGPGGGTHGLTGTGWGWYPAWPAQIGGPVAGCRGPASRRAARPSIRARELAWR